MAGGTEWLFWTDGGQTSITVYGGQKQSVVDMADGVEQLIMSWFLKVCHNKNNE